MKVKASELQGEALDWAVAKCDQPQWSDEDALLWVQDDEYQYNPSTDWSQGGRLIERERISIEDCQDGAGLYWEATRIEPPAVSEARGPTPLIAAMRCYVVSQLGDEIEVPDELKGGEL
jgi:hypothetical protein